MPRTILQERLAWAMKRRGMSRRGLSLRAGFGESAVKHIMVGDSLSPQHGTVERLARELEVSVAFLLGETDDPVPAPKTAQSHIEDRSFTPLAKLIDVNRLAMVIEVVSSRFSPGAKWDPKDFADAVVLAYDVVTKAMSRDGESQHAATDEAVIKSLRDNQEDH